MAVVVDFELFCERCVGEDNDLRMKVVSNIDQVSKCRIVAAQSELGTGDRKHRSGAVAFASRNRPPSSHTSTAELTW